MADHGLELVHFAKHERKEDIADGYLADRDGSERASCSWDGAQEKASVFRTKKRRNPITGKSYPWLAALPAHLLPPLQAQAIPQARPRPPHRDDRQ